jgi:hypothetical protein
MTTKITAYLCPINESAIDFVLERSTKQFEVNRDSHTVTAKIIPIGGCSGLKNIARARLYPEAIDINKCIQNKFGEGVLSWERPRAFESGLARYIDIEYTNPEAICSWIQTNVNRTRQLAETELLSTHPAYTGGAIPLNSSKPYSYQIHMTASLLQTTILPGEYLKLKWMMRFYGNILSAVVDSCYFATPAVTGGIIVSKTGDDEETRFNVSVQGISVSLRPSDFAQYQVGSWVYILKWGESSATERDRDSAFGSDSVGTITADMRLIPIIVNSPPDIVDASLFTPKEYNMLDGFNFEKFFEMSTAEAEILEIDYENDTAKILMNDVEYEDVEFFYHCYGGEDPVFGSSAFVIGDSVMVLIEYGHKDPDAENLSIIGFTDVLKHCIWTEPWDGPNIDSKWPWAHLYLGVNEYPSPPTFQDLSEIIITECPPETTKPVSQDCSYLSVEIDGTTPGEGWIEYQHVWRYEPSHPIYNAGDKKVNKIIVNTEVNRLPRYGFDGTQYHSYGIQLVGYSEEEGPVYFQIYFMNNYSGYGIPIIASWSEGFPEPVESDWAKHYGDWIRTVDNNKTEWIQFPVPNVRIDLIQVYVSVTVLYTPPVPSSLNPVSFIVNHLALSP